MYFYHLFLNKLMKIAKTFALASAVLLSAAVLISCGNKTFTFVQMTDTQLGFADNRTFEQDSINCMVAVGMVNALEPDFVVITGDLVDNPISERQNECYAEVLGAIIPETWQLPGNHDYRPVHPDQTLEESVELFRNLRGYNRFAFVHSKTGFLGFDSNIIKEGESTLEEEQYQWMEDRLADMSAECRQIFLFCHCPVVLESLEEPENYDNFSIPMRKRYMELFSRYGVDAVFSGHLHHCNECEIEGIRMITTGAAGLSLQEGCSEGFGRITVSRNTFEYEFVPLK